MTDIVVTLGALYAPILILGWCLLAILRLRKAPRHDTVVTLQPFGILGISLPLNNRLAARVTLIGAGLASLGSYALYDYSSFFPQHLEMDVYFDQVGLNRALDVMITPGDRDKFGIPSDYERHRVEYFKLLDGELAKVMAAGFFSTKEGIVHSSGQTSFKVAKLEGWQRYYVKEAKGELVHTLEAPHSAEKHFLTFFEKMPSAGDYLHMSVRDAVTTGGILMRPRFKQALAENRTSQSVSFNVSVVGLTRISVFPWPEFSATVYCAEFLDVGLVPVAYAMYR